MSCRICGDDFKHCPHSVRQVNDQRERDAMEEAIDRRLIELGVVEKTHSKIMQASKARQRRAGRDQR